MEPVKSYIAYTDGGYSQKKNVGAFAYVLLEGEDVIDQKYYVRYNETNNRMELKAIIAVVYDAIENCEIEVRTDSQYAIGVLSGKWKATSNLDLIELFRRIIGEKNIKVTFKWVKGHNGDEYNEYCDSLCDKAVGFDLNEEYAKYKKR